MTFACKGANSICGRSHKAVGIMKTLQMPDFDSKLSYRESHCLYFVGKTSTLTHVMLGNKGLRIFACRDSCTHEVAGNGQKFSRAQDGKQWFQSSSSSNNECLWLLCLVDQLVLVSDSSCVSVTFPNRHAVWSLNGLLESACFSYATYRQYGSFWAFSYLMITTWLSQQLYQGP